MSKFLSNLKNGIYNGRSTIIVNYSKYNIEIAEFLSLKRYISGFEVTKKKAILVFLNFDDKLLPAISELSLVSKPERVIKFRKTKYNRSSNPLSNSFFRARNSTKGYGELAFILR